MAARYLIGRCSNRIGAVAATNVGEVVDHRGEECIRGFEDELALGGYPTELVLGAGELLAWRSCGWRAAAPRVKCGGGVRRF